MTERDTGRITGFSRLVDIGRGIVARSRHSQQETGSVRITRHTHREVVVPACRIARSRVSAVTARRQTAQHHFRHRSSSGDRTRGKPVRRERRDARRDSLAPHHHIISTRRAPRDKQRAKEDQRERRSPPRTELRVPYVLRITFCARNVRPPVVRLIHHHVRTDRRDAQPKTAEKSSPSTSTTTSARTRSPSGTKVDLAVTCPPAERSESKDPPATAARGALTAPRSSSPPLPPPPRRSLPLPVRPRRRRPSQAALAAPLTAALNCPHHRRA